MWSLSLWDQRPGYGPGLWNHFPAMFFPKEANIFHKVWKEKMLKIRMLSFIWINLLEWKIMAHDWRSLDNIRDDAN